MTRCDWIESNNRCFALSYGGVNQMCPETLKGQLPCAVNVTGNSQELKRVTVGIGTTFEPSPSDIQNLLRAKAEMVVIGHVFPPTTAQR